jgi:hypothetical protein
LHGATSLSVRELFAIHLNNFPLRLLVVVVKLYGVDVLSSFVGNSTEHIDKPVRESARAVVVSTDVHIWHFKPKIDV